MKAILEFDLEEERDEFEAAVAGTEYKCALLDIDRELRHKLKYMDADVAVMNTAREFLDHLRNLIPDSVLR